MSSCVVLELAVRSRAVFEIHIAFELACQRLRCNVSMAASMKDFCVVHYDGFN